MTLSSLRINGNQRAIRYTQEPEPLRTVPQRPTNPVARSLDLLEKTMNKQAVVELTEKQLAILMAFMAYAYEQKI